MVIFGFAACLLLLKSTSQVSDDFVDTSLANNNLQGFFL